MKIKNFQIVCGDNVEVMKSLPSESVDLIVTSPPYDGLRDYQGYSFNFEGVAEQLYRITKPGGVVAWNVGDATVDGSETGTSFQQALYFMTLGFNLHDTMIYQKASTPFPSNNRYNQVFEYIFILSKGKPKTFNGIKDRPNKTAGQSAWNRGGERQKDGSIKPRSKRGRKIINDFGLRGNVWFYSPGYMKTSRDKIAYEHPALMHEDLAKDLIISFSNPGDLVLDPFAGGGTTLKMARLTGRKCIGIEIAKKYCKLIEKRLASITDSDLTERIMKSAAAHLN